MGCDIHLFIEHRTSYDTWECVDNFQINKDAAKNLNIKTVKDIPEYLNLVSLYKWRSYAFFTLLAGVRDVGDVERIHDARGLPHDVSDVVRAYNDYWGRDGHSHSWYSVKELFKYKHEMKHTLEHTGKSESSEDLMWAYGGLKKMCKNIVQRISEVEYFDYEKKSVKKEKAKKVADQYRVVFWFDC